MARKKMFELPPGMEETKGELAKQPETAPLKPDRRTQRSAGRSCQFNIHVPESFKDEYEAVKKRDRLLNRWHWAAVAMQAYNALSREDRDRLISEVMANDPAMQQFPNSKR
jgi:hypothetical protein